MRNGLALGKNAPFKAMIAAKPTLRVPLSRRFSVAPMMDGAG